MRTRIDGQHRDNLVNRIIRVSSLFLIVLLLVFLRSSAQERGWNGILPLHSTRADVERRFGLSDDPCRCLYRTVKEMVSVEYARAPCEGPPYGWNVPINTVLEVVVHPKIKLALTELGLDENMYVKSRDVDDPVTVYYTSVQKGVKYSVQNGEVTSITYVPSSNEKPLRCRGFPDYDGGIREYHPYTSFSIKAEMMDERLDDFAVQLINRTSMKGYIIAYAGKTSRQKEARIMANKAKQYLTTKRKISPDRLVAIDGGFRETAEYDLFLIPSTFLPPTPTPTFSFNEVKIFRIHRTSKKHHLSLRGCI